MCNWTCSFFYLLFIVLVIASRRIKKKLLSFFMLRIRREMQRLLTFDLTTDEHRRFIFFMGYFLLRFVAYKATSATSNQGQPERRASNEFVISFANKRFHPRTKRGHNLPRQPRCLKKRCLAYKVIWQCVIKGILSYNLYTSILKKYSTQIFQTFMHLSTSEYILLAHFRCWTTLILFFCSGSITMKDVCVTSPGEDLITTVFHGLAEL